MCAAALLAGACAIASSGARPGRPMHNSLRRLRASASAALVADVALLVCVGFQLSVVEYLIDNGSAQLVDERDIKHMTALHYASAPSLACTLAQHAALHLRSPVSAHLLIQSPFLPASPSMHPSLQIAACASNFEPERCGHGGLLRRTPTDPQLPSRRCDAYSQFTAHNTPTQSPACVLYDRPRGGRVSAYRPEQRVECAAPPLASRASSKRSSARGVRWICACGRATRPSTSPAVRRTV